MMKALSYNPDFDVFKIVQLPIPFPRDEEVQIKVIACGLNPIDSKIFKWKSLVPKMDENFVVGLDVVGEVTAIGRDVHHWKVGDMVLYHGNMLDPNGGAAEYTVQVANALLELPSIPPVIAASTPCAAWTAWRALIERLDIRGKRSLFISGASGCVGSFAIQIARYAGLKEIIVTSSTSNAEYVRKLGATHVIDYRNQDVEQKVLEITDGRGVDVALDCVGGESAINAGNVLKYEGALLSLVDVINLLDIRDAKARGITVYQFSLGTSYQNGTTAISTMIDAGNEVNRLLVENVLVAPKVTQIAIEEAPDVLMAMRNQHFIGKNVVCFSR